MQSGMLGIGAYLVVADKASGGVVIASSIMMGPRASRSRSRSAPEAARLARGLARLREICKARGAKGAARVLPRRAANSSCKSVVRSGADKPIVSTFRLLRGHGPGSAPAIQQNHAVEGAGRIWPAGAGAVQLDGAALDQWRKVSAATSATCREVALFDGTVAENICRFEEEATSDAILKAAKIAGVHDIILGLQDGYATRIGGGGMSLSAGQRQRIGLARAVFGDPFLIVLDEPNANLDAEGENALTRAIQILRHNKCIVIVISHRPSALTALDMAMVLYQGKMIAFGPSAEVFARVQAANEHGAAAKPKEAKVQEIRKTPVVESAVP